MASALAFAGRASAWSARASHQRSAVSLQSRSKLAASEAGAALFLQRSFFRRGYFERCPSLRQATGHDRIFGDGAYTLFYFLRSFSMQMKFRLGKADPRVIACATFSVIPDFFVVHSPFAKSLKVGGFSIREEMLFVVPYSLERADSNIWSATRGATWRLNRYYRNLFSLIFQVFSAQTKWR